MDPKNPKLEEFKNSENFIEQVMNPFIKKLNQEIEKIKD